LEAGRSRAALVAAARRVAAPFEAATALAHLVGTARFVGRLFFVESTEGVLGDRVFDTAGAPVDVALVALCDSFDSLVSSGELNVAETFEISIARVFRHTDFHYLADLVHDFLDGFLGRREREVSAEDGRSLASLDDI